jgi:hypothetical protein
MQDRLGICLTKNASGSDFISARYNEVSRFMNFLCQVGYGVGITVCEYFYYGGFHI